MLYFSETTLFSVQFSSAQEFDFNFCINTQSSVLFWSWLMICSFHVSLLFNLSIKLLSELMIFSFALMNSHFVVDFDLRKREKFLFSIFDLQRSHLWSYWVEWELVLIIWLCSITCWLIWYIMCFDRLLSSLLNYMYESWCILTNNDLKIWYYRVEWKQSEVQCKQEMMYKQEIMTVNCIYNKINMINVLILALIWWMCWLQL